MCIQKLQGGPLSLYIFFNAEVQKCIIFFLYNPYITVVFLFRVQNQKNCVLIVFDLFSITICTGRTIAGTFLITFFGKQFPMKIIIKDASAVALPHFIYFSNICRGRTIDDTFFIIFFGSQFPKKIIIKDAPAVTLPHLIYFSNVSASQKAEIKKQSIKLHVIAMLFDRVLEMPVKDDLQGHARSR